ncbi:MAG: hypothetical protein ACWGQW_03995 [bacterium]
MANGKKERRQRLYDLDTEQIKTRLNDMADRCRHLADHLSDFGTEQLNPEDRSLIRIAYIGILKTHFSEATYNVMAGEMERAHESLQWAQSLIEQLP